MVWKLLQTVNKHLIIAIPALMIAGFVAGIYLNAAPLKQLIVPFTFLMVYPMMVTLKIKKVIEGGDTKAQLLTQNYDLVIMGTHGHSKMDDLMLGSVARDGVHGCPVPVMVIRLPDQTNDWWKHENSVNAPDKQRSDGQ